MLELREGEVIEPGFRCRNCGAVYQALISQCDCIPEKDEFTPCVIIDDADLADLHKQIACEFFRWWHNQPGSNTEQGFGDWWERREDKR